MLVLDRPPPVFVEALIRSKSFSSLSLSAFCSSNVEVISSNSDFVDCNAKDSSSFAT